MTSTASLHFGPEWMRKPARAPPVSPNPNGAATSLSSTHSSLPHNVSTTAPPLTASPATSIPTQSSYSSLLASPMASDPVLDSSNPFRYSREQMLAVWKSGGGQGELGLEVERWPGIVREIAGEPLGLTEPSPEERKAHTLPYNSDPPTLRRRGDSYSSQTPLITMPGGGLDSMRDRNKLVSPIRTFGGASGAGSISASGSSVGIGLPGRRKKDENGQDIPVYRPRQLSLGTGGNPNGAPPSPGALPSPGLGGGVTRPRLGGTSFDGVMGDTWGGGTARRRVSEPRIATLASNRGADDKMEGLWRTGSDPRFRDEITEEPSMDSWDTDVKKLDPLHEPYKDMGSVDGSGRASAPISDLSASVDHLIPGGSSGPPLPDAFNVEDISWSYKDPTGQVQGPFTATIMQNWYAGGYFTDDLLIKRVELDHDFDPLQDYKNRVLSPGTVETLFLSPVAAKAPGMPPGLIDRPSPQQSPFGQLLSQPGRVDGNSSTSPASGPSPSIGNPSTLSSYAPSPAVPSTGFNSSPALGGLLSDAEKQRQDREDFLRSLREKELASHSGSILDGIASGVGVGIDIPSASHFMGAGGASNPYHGGSRDDGFSAGLTSSLNDLQPYSAQSPLADFSSQQPAYPSSINTTSYPGSQVQLSALDTLYSPSTMQQSNNSIWPRSPQTNLPDHRDHFGNAPSAAQPASNPSPWYSIIEPSNIQFDGPISPFANVGHPQTPWNQHPNGTEALAAGSGSLMGGPFDHNAMGQQPDSFQSNNLQPEHERLMDSYVSGGSQLYHSNGDMGNALSAGLEAMDLNGRVQHAPESSELPTATVEHVTPSRKAADVNKAPQKQAITSKTSAINLQSTANAKAWSTTPSSSSVSTRPAALAPDSFPVVGTSAFSEPTGATSPSPSGTAKPTVWSNFAADDKNASAVSLRKIQETEAKKVAESKKLEREKERAAKSVAAATATPSPGLVPALPDTISSWGLPQVGRAPPGPAAPISPAGASVAGAWATKPAKITKKTMKEIQEEEEEKRKKEAVLPVQPAATPSAASLAAAAKRAYAESAKTSAATPASTPNGWTTIVAGKGTKPAAAATSATAVPSASARPTGVAALPPRPSGAAMSPSPSSSSSTSARLKQQPAQKPSEDIAPPSLEFIRWMRDALRGLTGASVDEFMQMLLSFPLDPPPSVMEIISDSVYASSATLDGRRFATEFVAKRKADAANAKAFDAKQAGLYAGRVSVADVVKTQKSPDDGEWSTKPVKAKKKSTRGGSAN